MSLEKFFKLVDCLVFPVGQYATEMLSPLSLPLKSFQSEKSLLKAWESFHLEKINQRACRLFSSVQKKTSRLAVLRELGRYPVMIKSLIQSIMYKRSIDMHQSTSLLGKAVQEMKELDTSSSWLGRVNNIKQLLGIPEYPQYWSDERVKRNIVHTFQSKFELFFKDEIGSENIGKDGFDHNKLRFYRTFKSCFKPEFYIENVQNRNQRAWLSRLRTSSHRLEVERGRYRGIALGDRLCRYCPEKEIDDENHFLHNCSIFVNERENLFTEMEMSLPGFKLLSETDKVKSMLCPATTKTAKLINRFIETMFKTRDKIDKESIEKVQNQGADLNISDSDSVYQSDSSDDEN